MQEAELRRLIQAVADTVIAHVDELTALDAALGDGDHGLNMKRGFEAVLAKLDDIAPKPLPAAVQEVGRTLVMTVGGASGAIFGTAFLAFGRAIPDDPRLADLAPALDAAIAATKARGKSEVGQKTMLDVLAPVAAALHAGRRGIAGAADQAAAATAGMAAVRGRASFLGERSVGKVDAGARSAALIIGAIATSLEARP